MLDELSIENTMSIGIATGNGTFLSDWAKTRTGRRHMKQTIVMALVLMEILLSYGPGHRFEKRCNLPRIFYECAFMRRDFIGCPAYFQSQALSKRRP
jgi:hypothetical protein